MSQTFTMDDLKRMLQERQHKMTPQRQVVLQIFLDHPGEHLSAEDVHGILQKMEFGDGCSRYEVNRTDPSKHHHHHLICTNCGKVIEFQDDLLEPLEDDIKEKLGFTVSDHQVKFFGLCKECQEAQK